MTDTNLNLIKERSELSAKMTVYEIMDELMNFHEENESPSFSDAFMIVVKKGRELMRHDIADRTKDNLEC